MTNRNGYHFSAAVIILFACLFLALSCADDGGSSGFWPAQGGDIDGDVERDIEIQSPPSDLWAMKFTIAYTTELPVLEQTVQLVMVGIARTKVIESYPDFYFYEEICDFRMEIVEDIPFYILYPELSISAIPILRRYGRFEEIDGELRFYAPIILDIYGAEETSFDNPFTDPLPTDPEDPIVIDFEGDGNPGVTASISGFVQGEVYVLFRMMRQLSGAVISEGHIKGKVTSSVEMVTLDADPELLLFQLDLQKFDDNPDFNRFEYVKLSEKIDCEEIVERQKDIFSYQPINSLDSLESPE